MTGLVDATGRPMGPSTQQIATTVAQLIDAVQHLGQRQQAMFQQQIHLGIHIDYLRETLNNNGIECDTTSEEFLAYAKSSYEEIQREFKDAADEARVQVAQATQPEVAAIDLDDEEVPTV